MPSLSPPNSATDKYYANLRHAVAAVQSLSRVRLSVTPWAAARQASCPSPTPRFAQTQVHRVSDAL